LQPPVAETSVEISRSRRPRHLRKPKTCRTEIRLRDCRRPTNTDSGSASDLQTNCAPCRRALAAPIIRNRRSRKPEGCAKAGSGRRGRQVIRLKPRQGFPYAWSANRPSKEENAERSTPNAQRSNKENASSFGILFGRADVRSEYSDELLCFLENGLHFRR
jgi:hypothetical protein